MTQRASFPLGWTPLNLHIELSRLPLLRFQRPRFGVEGIVLRYHVRRLLTGVYPVGEAIDLSKVGPVLSTAEA